MQRRCQGGPGLANPIPLHLPGAGRSMPLTVCVDPCYFSEHVFPFRTLSLLRAMPRLCVSSGGLRNTVMVAYGLYFFFF